MECATAKTTALSVELATALMVLVSLGSLRVGRFFSSLVSGSEERRKRQMQQK
jgi:hypothetical protein